MSSTILLFMSSVGRISGTRALFQWWSPVSTCMKSHQLQRLEEWVLTLSENWLSLQTKCHQRVVTCRMIGLKQLYNLVGAALIPGDSSQTPSSGEKKRKQKRCGTGFWAGLKSIVMQPAPSTGKCYVVNAMFLFFCFRTLCKSEI